VDGRHQPGAALQPRQEQTVEQRHQQPLDVDHVDAVAAQKSGERVEADAVLDALAVAEDRAEQCREPFGRRVEVRLDREGVGPEPLPDA